MDAAVAVIAYHGVNISVCTLVAELYLDSHGLSTECMKLS